jgi:spore germination protein YaaH
MKIATQFLILLLFSFSPLCFGMQNAFYVLHDKKATQEALSIIAKHRQDIDIIISQAYHTDKAGVVTGYIDPNMLAFSHAHSIKLMALVTNSLFDSNVAHKFLLSKAAQQKALTSLVMLCKKNHLYGVQLDFEMVALKDKQALTNFYKTAANYFHQQGFVVSFAVAPTVNDATSLSSYHRRMHKVWAGAYDLETLGRYADFITIMTYDQHLGLVAPGPTAGARWVEEVIRHTLKYIPAGKISLGVPSYSRYWYTGLSSHSQKIRMQSSSIDYKTVQKLLQKRNARLKWDTNHKVNYAFYEHNWLNEYIFVEDVDSFRAKLALIKKYHLRGMSFFRIGMEDPDIWRAL